MRTRIKICGFTRAQDVQAACTLGVDAVGLVFYPSSPRHVSLQTAVTLSRQVPALVSVVALFVNPTEQTVRQTMAAVQPHVLQFHGEETPQFCRQFQQPYFKAFRVGSAGRGSVEGGGTDGGDMDSAGVQTASELATVCQRYPDAAGWLFDSYSADYGGSGISFETALLDDVRKLSKTRPDTPPIILSGGLNAATVGGMIQRLRPWAVDVSSGVEEAKGIKSADKMAAFVRAVQQVKI